MSVEFKLGRPLMHMESTYQFVIKFFHRHIRNASHYTKDIK